MIESWLVISFFTSKSDFEDEFLSEKEIISKNLYKLAANRRAISNFVSIVTGKNIPVRFSTKGDSYTDGETVTISSKISEPAEFDVAVGLALHEGSHIVLSDFDLLSEMNTAFDAYRYAKIDIDNNGGDIVSKIGEQSEDYLILDISAKKNGREFLLYYDICKWTTKGQIIQYGQTEIVKESAITWSRNNRIDDILS